MDTVSPEERNKRLTQCAADHVADGWRLVERFEDIVVLAWGLPSAEARRTLTVTEAGVVLFRDPGKDYAPVADAPTAASATSAPRVASTGFSKGQQWFIGGVVCSLMVMTLVAAVLFSPTQSKLERARKLDAQDHAMANEVPTMEAFLRIKNRMSYSEVVRIIGREGELSVSSDDGGSIYSWTRSRCCANMSVHLQDDRVISKSQAGLD